MNRRDFLFSTTALAVTAALPAFPSGGSPLAFGRVLNAPAQMDNAFSLIYRVHNGPIAAVEAVYDGGLPLLKVAGNPAPGEFAERLSGGSFQLGGTPAFTVTADVRGRDGEPLPIETHVYTADDVAGAADGVYWCAGRDGVMMERRFA